ncbi:Trm112 family protein [Desulfolithobacter sp.]
MIQKELLDILACPKCKGPVSLTEKKDGLICSQCSLIYPIRDEIPIMLIDEARSLKKKDASAGSH